MFQTPTLLLFLLITMALLNQSSALISPIHRLKTTTQLQMGWADAMKGAFSNEESLGKPQNAGLSGGPKYNDQVTVNGKVVKKAVVGQKVGIAANSVRAKISYNCNNGDCGTCTITMNGRSVKACQTTIPSGKCVILTP